MASSQTAGSAERRAPEEILQTDMTVEGLRNFCRRAGVTRSHGDNKMETIRKIMDQAPDEARNWLNAQGYELTEAPAEA